MTRAYEFPAAKSGSQANFQAKGASDEDITWNLDGIQIDDMATVGDCVWARMTLHAVNISLGTEVRITWIGQYRVADGKVTENLLAGELDVVNGIPDVAWVEKMQGEEGVTTDVFGVGEVATVHFNTTVEPLDNPEVRKALAYALDRDEFLALFGEPVAENVYSQVPSKFLAGGLTQEEVEALDLAYNVDRERAKQMLADRMDLKVVTTLHGTDITLVGQEPSFRPITRFVIQQSDAVTAVSGFLREETDKWAQARRLLDR